MTLHLSATQLAAALTPVTGLLALWLRWRTRQEHARRGTLVDLARSVRPGSELEETAADGTHLRVTMTASGSGTPDQSHRDIHPTDLDRVRWTSATRWPPAWQAWLRDNSVQVRLEVWEVRPGTAGDRAYLPR